MENIFYQQEAIIHHEENHSALLPAQAEHRSAFKLAK